jgi:mannose-6-phosphate isomerase-like protein (cupin superfamily)
VYVLVAPEPDRQRPHEDDELYVVLEGTGVLQVEGEDIAVREEAPSSSRPAPTIASPRTSI